MLKNVVVSQNDETINPPLFQRKWFIWLTLILLPPLGVVLIWKFSYFSRRNRILLSLFFLTLFFTGPVIILSGELSYGVLAPSNIVREDVWDGDRILEVSYISISAIELKNITERQFKVFIEKQVNKNMERGAISIIIGNQYVMQFDQDGSGNFYYGLLGDYAQAEYPISVNYNSGVSYTRFVEELENYNQRIWHNVELDCKVRLENKEKIIAKVNGQIDGLVGGMDVNGLAIGIADDGGYTLEVPREWMYGFDDDKRAFITILLDTVKDANYQYVGNGLVTMRVFDDTGREVAKYNPLSGFYDPIDKL